MAVARLFRGHSRLAPEGEAASGPLRGARRVAAPLSIRAGGGQSERRRSAGSGLLPRSGRLQVVWFRVAEGLRMAGAHHLPRQPAQQVQAVLLHRLPTFPPTSRAAIGAARWK